MKVAIEAMVAVFGATAIRELWKNLRLFRRVRAVVQYGSDTNRVVRGHALMECGCLLSPHGVEPCKVHAAILEAQSK